MKRRTAAATIAGVIVVGGILAWSIARRGDVGPLRAGAARLAIEWSGRLRGRMAFPARVQWCPVTRVAVLEAVSGDSGVAIVLYEQNALTAVSHPVYNPDAAASAQRPSATAAMRWMRLDKDTALAGFRALSGTVQVRLAPGTVSGEIDARMRGVTGSDSSVTLVVRGVFRDVPVVSTAVGCS